jgi:hypothetical protein
MTDFRALCAELHAAFNTYAVDMKHHDLLERARAALTEPKPPSLKDQALDELDRIPTHDNEGRTVGVDVSIIRRALEALPE